MRHVLLTDFLTEDQIMVAKEIYEIDHRNFHKRVVSEVIEPNMQSINNKLGQSNDPHYLAYAIEHVFNQVGKS